MRLPSTSTVFFVSGCSVIGFPTLYADGIRTSAANSVRRHENRQAKAGKMVQRLIDPDQRPEPWMRRFQRHAKCRGAKSLGAVDCDVNGKIDQCYEPEPRRDHQDQHHCNRQMHETM